MPIRCAYSEPLKATCLAILTPSHSVPTLSSSFVDMYGCPIMTLDNSTYTSNNI